jgi:prolycopene isomerase
VLSEHVKDPRARALFTALWPYQGLPPSKLGVIQFGLVLASFLNTGVYYCEGTFQKLPNALVTAIEADGSEILLRTTVRRITVNDGKVTGVVLENGQRISAPIVVSNADATQTFEELVGIEHLPSEHVELVRSLRPSLSAVNAYIATDLDLANHPNAAHSIFFFDSWDHDEVYKGMCEGRPSHLSIAIPSLVDPALAPEGEHVMSVVMLVPYELAVSWREEKEQFQQALMRQLEVVLPGINDHLTFAEGASPRTMERYTLNHLGALYGWEATPGDTGVDRLSHRTPIEGLFLSGHWTRPGGGLVPVMVSGMQTAQIVLGDSSVREVVESLGERP